MEKSRICCPPAGDVLETRRLEGACGPRSRREQGRQGGNGAESVAGKGRSARGGKQGRHGRRRAHCSSWGLQGKSGCEELRFREREPSRDVATWGGDNRAAGRHGDRLLLCLLGLQAAGGVENQQGAARLGNMGAIGLFQALKQWRGRGLRLGSGGSATARTGKGRLVVDLGRGQGK
ncbi:hypothetical protein ZEAMMB73_Zm00001d019570 [Zea mays]|jgi:hypothetical protein|uniref:Uncharacterized protein n=1 Tax=Zea mays TaxID=4577 RepID=A0A1D6HYS9_MAIZE|nr:hypothetical protein ZEAMMB73_Zm00001d019570 [Zea mays]